MEQPPKQLEGEERQKIEESPERDAVSFEVPPIAGDSEEVRHEKEEIRARLNQNIEHSSSEKPDDEKNESSEEKQESDTHSAKIRTHAQNVASETYRPLRGFFGLLFVWFFGGIKKSLGAKGGGGDHGGGAAKKPSGGGHGSGGGHH